MEEQQGHEAGEGTGEVVSGGRAIMLAHLNLVRAPQQTLNMKRLPNYMLNLVMLMICQNVKYLLTA